MAAKKKSAARPATARTKTAPTKRIAAKKATKKSSRPAAVLETLKRDAKKAVTKAVKVAKRKINEIVDAEHAIEDRIKAAVARKRKKKAARPA